MIWPMSATLFLFNFSLEVNNNQITLSWTSGLYLLDFKSPLISPRISILSSIFNFLCNAKSSFSSLEINSIFLWVEEEFDCDCTFMTAATVALPKSFNALYWALIFFSSNVHFNEQLLLIEGASSLLSDNIKLGLMPKYLEIFSIIEVRGLLTPCSQDETAEIVTPQILANSFWDNSLSIRIFLGFLQ